MFSQSVLIISFSLFTINSEKEEKNRTADSGSSKSLRCKRRNIDSAGACALSDLFGETSSRPKRQGSPVSLQDQAEDKVKKYKQAEPLGPSGDPVS